MDQDDRLDQDDQLIEKIKSGDQSSFRMLIHKYRQYLFRAVYAVLRHEEDAKDALQEAFIKIYYALPQYEGQGLKAWMSRIAVNHAIDMKRKQLRQVSKAMEYSNELEYAADSLSNRATLDIPLLMKERTEMVMSRLQELPDNYRSVVEAHYLHEKTYKQIADELQVEAKTVEMRLYRARQWMRKHWKEDEF